MIDPKSCDDIPALLPGLQHLHAAPVLRSRLSALIESGACPGLLGRVGGLAVESGHRVAGKKPGEPLRGRFDSFCVETDAGLLWAAMRCAIRHAARQSRELGVPGWRQHQHVTGKVVKKAFSQVRTSKLAKRSPGQVRHQLLEGEPVCVIEDQYRFILHHEVMWEGGDAEHAMPTVESAQERPPELCMTLL